MKICDLNDIESIVLTKLEIEQQLLEHHIIDKKYTLDSFIQYIISDSKNIYTYINKETDKMYSFLLYKLDDETYAFNVDDLDSDKFNKIIAYANDLSSLENVTSSWFENESLEDAIIHNMQYYKISI